MDPIVLTIGSVAAIVATSYCFKVAVNAIVRVFEARKLDRSSSDAIETQQRIERLELAIDAVAIELERVGEVQRFSVQLARGSSDQMSQPILSPDGQNRFPRAVTPH